MRATGIVRRIDDLGRVVIPKEIRRTLRIREGDPMEIYTDAEGEVIFRKYSPLGELAAFSEQYVQVLHRITRCPALITDRDHVIAAAGISRKLYLDRPISPELDDLIADRQSYAAGPSAAALMPTEGEDRKVSVMAPIISAGDITGAVLLLLPDPPQFPTETEIKLVKAAADFLATA